ncbi:glucose 1-dehydrogenase [Altererythrobacter aquaemixtae]|uniref:Glucose 1-dehydrogenase n=2 Tax=Pontixanthobacter aquaemixtae TaxID=1958940 RepID=A0A844ZQ11_9SPHN|nr:glucose 1-dehydrogenase [Pontixanthobacter aquaemixtae]
MQLKDKIAVVTGAGSGIGRAIAQRFAKEGAKVAVWDMNGDGIEETVSMIKAEGGEAIGTVVDVSSKDAIAKGGAEVRDAFGDPNILVNNAGISPFVPFFEITEEQWDKVNDVNTKGQFFCIREFLQAMLDAKWGRVVNITSSSTQSGSFAQVHYVASKGGVLGMTKALALEYAASGVTFNMVPPGVVDTPSLRAAPIDIDEYAKTLPMKRIGRPEEIASACLFLASEDSSYLTGQTLSTNGGRYMGSA